ncbi:MAG: phytanoyl-CoA dioxygenase family protein [Hyphomonadaceae bacterium]
MNPLDLRKISYWRDLAPQLSIEGATQNRFTAPRQSFERLAQRMSKDGYFQEADNDLIDAAARLGETITRCVERGLPAVFVWLYDEPWRCFARLRPVLSHFLGPEYKMLPDFWAWHVDPRKSEAGWSPHIDRGGQRTLAVDGSPLSLTCWIPLTDANPLNSCMYLIPAFLDPFYGRAHERNQLPRPETIRALPAKPGEYLIWNQAVLHWGSSASEFADGPRMSMAIEFQRGDIAPFNSPLLDQIPDFAERRRLLGKQILQYKHMYKFTTELVALANHFLSSPEPYN